MKPRNKQSQKPLSLNKQRKRNDWLIDKVAKMFGKIPGVEVQKRVKLPQIKWAEHIGIFDEARPVSKEYYERMLACMMPTGKRVICPYCGAGNNMTFFASPAELAKITSPHREGICPKIPKQKEYVMLSCEVEKNNV